MRKQEVLEVRQLDPGHRADMKPRASFCGALAKHWVWGASAASHSRPREPGERGGGSE